VEEEARPGTLLLVGRGSTETGYSSPSDKMAAAGLKRNFDDGLAQILEVSLHVLVVYVLACCKVGLLALSTLSSSVAMAERRQSFHHCQYGSKLLGAHQTIAARLLNGSNRNILGFLTTCGT
jgi:hypothetical protein